MNDTARSTFIQGAENAVIIVLIVLVFEARYPCRCHHHVVLEAKNYLQLHFVAGLTRIQFGANEASMLRSARNPQPGLLLHPRLNSMATNAAPGRRE